MKLFFMVWPLLLLLLLFFFDVWVIQRRSGKSQQADDLEATLARYREAYHQSLREAKEALREAKEAERIIRHKFDVARRNAKAG